MRKLTAFDTIERVFMEASPEEFGQLEERVATIKRLRALVQPKTDKPQKPRSKPANGNGKSGLPMEHEQ